MGRRVSVWEAEAERRTDTVKAKEAAAESRENRQRIQQEATSGRKLLSLETKRLERKRHLDQQREEIHPERSSDVTGAPRAAKPICLVSPQNHWVPPACHS